MLGRPVNVIGRADETPEEGEEAFTQQGYQCPCSNLSFTATYSLSSISPSQPTLHPCLSLVCLLYYMSIQEPLLSFYYKKILLNLDLNLHTKTKHTKLNNATLKIIATYSNVHSL